MRASGWAAAVVAGMFACGLAPGQQTEVAPMHIGGEVKAPSVVYSDDPKISDADAKLYWQGGQIYLWVGEDGLPSHVRVVKSTGVAGIDAAFLAAVKKYRFKPAMRDGKPVTVDLYIDMNISTF